jgi:hypothetical protein
VTREAGLDRVLLVMGSNFGDIDNDGYLDIYLGTGQPAYFYVVPNVMLKNVDGRRFEDVTVSTGTGHLQKGHGISVTSPRAATTTASATARRSRRRPTRTRRPSPPRASNLAADPRKSGRAPRSAILAG